MPCHYYIVQLPIIAIMLDSYLLRSSIAQSVPNQNTFDYRGEVSQRQRQAMNVDHFFAPPSKVYLHSSHHNPLSSMTTHEEIHLLNYFAGFIDGEGCFSICLRKDTYYEPTLIVANNHRHPLDLLAHYAAGRVYTLGTRCYQWRVSHRQLRIFLPKLIPYLLVKREQAELMLEFLNLRPTQGKRTDPALLPVYRQYMLRLQEMKREGLRA